MADWKGANTFQKTDSQLQLAYYRALENASFKGGFLARTAHELRSPLNRIISLQQMILEDLCDDIEEEREFVAEAYAAAMKLLEYLDRMIQVSKIELGRVEPVLQTVSLAPIFEQVQEMTHLQAADRNLRLVVDHPETSLQVRADPAWLRNGLITLIEMALDSSDRGTIRLTVAPRSNSKVCHLWLEDDRPATYWQEAIALPKSSTFDLNDSLSGSLRLAMVEAMLTAMSGQLTLLSRSDEQTPTRLQLTLPVPQNDSP